MVETTSIDSTAYRALYTNAISRGRSIHNFLLPELRRRFDDHRRAFDTLRTGIEDPPVIVKSSAIWACRPALRHVHGRVESIYSKRSEEPKPAANASAITYLLRTSRLLSGRIGAVRQRVFHQAETGIDNSPAL